MLLTSANFDTSFKRVVYECFRIVWPQFIHTYSLFPPKTIPRLGSTFYSRAIRIVGTFIFAESAVVITISRIIVSIIYIFRIIHQIAMPVSTSIIEEYWKNKYIAELTTMKCLIQFSLYFIFCKIQQVVLLGQGFLLHLRVWEPEDPSFVQLPPNSGAGLSHNLVLFWLAPPQDTGQSSQSCQSPHVPLPVIDCK